MNKLFKNLLILMIILLSAKFILGFIGFIFYIVSAILLFIFNMLMFTLTAILLPIVIIIAIVMLAKYFNSKDEIQRQIDKTRDQIKF